MKAFETPYYVLHEDRVAARCEAVRRLWDGDLCYAMKANPFLAAPFAAAVQRIEVCSYGEYKICVQAHIDPRKVILSGVVKEEAALEEVLATWGSACVYTAESERQFALLENWAASHQTRLRVLARLSDGTQFGMDRTVIGALFRHHSPWIHLQGLHYFTGTMKRKPSVYAKEMAVLADVCSCIEAEGGHIDEIEYGPGIGVDYFADKAAKYIEADFFEALTEAAKPLRQKYRVTLEMGRALAAPCGEYVSRIVDCKVNGGTGYVLIDGGSHQVHYDGMMRGMHVPHLRTIPARKGDQIWTIAGSLCSVNDILASQARLGAVQIGDCLVFENAGAYAMDEGPALFLSHEQPAVYAVKGQAVRVLRRRMDTWPMHVDIEEDNQ